MRLDVVKFDKGLFLLDLLWLEQMLRFPEVLLDKFTGIFDLNEVSLCYILTCCAIFTLTFVIRGFILRFFIVLKAKLSFICYDLLLWILFFVAVGAQLKDTMLHD